MATCTTTHCCYCTAQLRAYPREVMPKAQETKDLKTKTFNLNMSKSCLISAQLKSNRQCLSTAVRQYCSAWALYQEIPLFIPQLRIINIYREPVRQVNLIYVYVTPPMTISSALLLTSPILPGIRSRRNGPIPDQRSRWLTFPLPLVVPRSPQLHQTAHFSIMHRRGRAALHNILMQRGHMGAEPCRMFTRDQSPLL